MLWMMLILLSHAHAQKKWDGGGNGWSWDDPLNWAPDGVPLATDRVWLDNEFYAGGYSVTLPTGGTSVAIRSIHVTPADAAVTVTLPSGNTAAPGIILSDTGDALVLGRNAVFVNASGAASGITMQLQGSVRIENGGRYVHRTPRGNADIIDRLSRDPGTEKGIFEFDVPGTAGYTVSLTGNTFGSLHFKAGAAGGAKSYSGSGSSTLSIRGDLLIEQGAQLTTTLTADITIGGGLTVSGTLNVHPVTAGTSGRTISFTGKGDLGGHGTLSLNPNFRELLISNTSQLQLLRDIILPFSSQKLVCQGKFNAGPFTISGFGQFHLQDGATLVSGADSGIQATINTGNIITTVRQFSNKASYMYSGTARQVAGDGLPDSVAGFGIDNPSGIDLPHSIFVRDSLWLNHGLVFIAPSVRMQLGNGCKVISPSNNFGTDSGWEESFICGALAMVITDTSRHFFPVGSQDKFRPIWIRQGSEGENSLEVKWKEVIPDTSLRTPSLQYFEGSGYWDILPELATDWYAGVSYYPQDLPPDPALGMVIASHTGSGWIALASQTEGLPGPGWIIIDTSQAMPAGLTIAYALNNALLPIRVLDFQAEQMSDEVKLYWLVADEESGLSFLLEKSTDGRTFKTMTRINSDNRERYFWIDKEPAMGERLLYYRLSLQLYKKDLQSRTVIVRRRSGGIKLFPNPVTDLVQINFPGQSSGTEIAIVHINGTVLRRLFVNSDTCQIRVTDLPPGFYLVRVLNKNGSFTLPFTKY
jgi:hypothetical protein